MPQKHILPTTVVKNGSITSTLDEAILYAQITAAPLPPFYDSEGPPPRRLVRHSSNRRTRSVVGGMGLAALGGILAVSLVTRSSAIIFALQPSPPVSQRLQPGDLPTLSEGDSSPTALPAASTISTKVPVVAATVPSRVAGGMIPAVPTSELPQVGAALPPPLPTALPLAPTVKGSQPIGGAALPPPLPTTTTILVKQAAAPHTVLVRPGDSLSSLAGAAHLDTVTLLAANLDQVTEANTLSAGVTLILPSGETMPNAATLAVAARLLHPAAQVVAAQPPIAPPAAVVQIIPSVAQATTVPYPMVSPPIVRAPQTGGGGPLEPTAPPPLRTSPTVAPPQATVKVAGVAGECPVGQMPMYQPPLWLPQSAQPVCLPLPIAEPTSPPAPHPRQIHVVGQGETMVSVAAIHHASVATLEAANPGLSAHWTLGLTVTIPEVGP